MKIGILSDTHDHIPNIQAIVERFIAEEVDHILHAGDFCSPFALRPLQEANIPWDGVFGNNDGEWLMLEKLARDLGQLRKGPIELSLGGRQIALMHEPVYLEALADSGHFDLIIYGHTHAPEQRKHGKGWIVNPGEGCGYLHQKATALLCELGDLSFEPIEIS